MLTGILALLKFIPGVEGLINGFLTAWSNTKIALYQAKTGTARDVAVAAIQAQAAVQVRWWFAALPEAVMGMTIAVYMAKAIMWDVVLGSMFGCHGVTAPGTCDMFITDALKGDLHWSFLAIVGGYFSLSAVDKFLNSKG
jgi:hypothetical protein